MTSPGATTGGGTFKVALAGGIVTDEMGGIAITDAAAGIIGAMTEGGGVTDVNFLEGHLSALLTRMGMK